MYILHFYVTLSSSWKSDRVAGDRKRRLISEKETGSLTGMKNYSIQKQLSDLLTVYSHNGVSNLIYKVSIAPNLRKSAFWTHIIRNNEAHCLRTEK